MANSRLRSRVGDIFTLPLDEQRVAYGQIVHKTPGGLCWLAVFEAVGEVDREPDVDAIVARPLALLGKSFDVLRKHGQWQMVGHRPVDPTSIPWPAFKVHTPSGWAVQDYTDARMRPASAEEIDRLPLDVTVAAIRVEHAARALFGQAPWIPGDYDVLLPAPETRTTAYVFSHEPPPAPSGHGEHVIEGLLAQHVAPSDSGTPHARFFLTVPNWRAWRRLRSGLKQLGLEPSARRGPDGEWSVVADAREDPRAFVPELESLAQSAGGTYDGHEQAIG